MGESLRAPPNPICFLHKHLVLLRFIISMQVFDMKMQFFFSDFVFLSCCFNVQPKEIPLLLVDSRRSKKKRR